MLCLLRLLSGSGGRHNKKHSSKKDGPRDSAPSNGGGGGSGVGAPSFGQWDASKALQESVGLEPKVLCQIVKKIMRFVFLSILLRGYTLIFKPCSIAWLRSMYDRTHLIMLLV